MAGATLAGLLCMLVLVLVVTATLALPIMALRRMRPYPPQRSRVARPARQEVLTPPGDSPTVDATPAPAAERSTGEPFDGFTGLYTSGLLQ